MSEFKKYRRKEVAELRTYELGENLSSKVSISEADKQNGSPKEGDMIARNPKNHEDQWLVAKKYFEDNFAPIEKDEVTSNNDDSIQLDLFDGQEIN